MVIELERLGNIYGDYGTGYAGNVWASDGLCPTLKVESGGGGRVPMIIDDMYRNRDIRLYNEYSPSLRSERNGLKTVACAMRGRGENWDQQLEISGTPELSNSLTTVNKDMMVMQENDKIKKRYRIRRLTALETWRIQDFKDEDFHKVENVVSNSQIYKIVGNSITRNVLVAIFGQLFKGCENKYKTAIAN